MNKKIEKSGLILSIIVILVLILLGVWWSQKTLVNNAPNNNTTTVVTNQATTTQVNGKVVVGVDKKTTQTVSSIIAGIPDVSTFASYLTSTGVSTLTKGTGPYTIFVPVNSAFGQLPAGSISKLDAAGKKRLVEYHIVANRAIDIDALSFGTIQALSKDMLNFSANQAGEPQVNSSFVLHEYKGSNGIVYMVSAVLLPPKK